MENSSRRIITINIEKEKYGIDISVIDSIIKLSRITKVPLVDDYYLGVINVRGSVIPVVSLGMKLGFEQPNISSESKIIILKSEENQLVGFLVDSVYDVIEVDESLYTESIPETLRNRIYIEGVLMQDSSMIAIINTGTLLFNLKNDSGEEKNG